MPKSAIAGRPLMLSRPLGITVVEGLEHRGNNPGYPMGHPGTYAGNGGILASAETLFHWMKAVTGGSVLPQARAENLFTRHIIKNKDRGIWYGNGWDVSTYDLGERVSHTGGNMVFFAYIEWIRDRDCIFTVTNNAFDEVDMAAVIRTVRAFTASQPACSTE